MSYIAIISIYFVAAGLVSLIARKLDEKLAFLAWVPFLNDYLITRLAKKPFYWWILMYIPVLNFYYDFVLWREIFKRFNRGVPYALLMLIPVFNWIGLFLIAVFLKKQEADEATEEGKEEKKETAGKS